MGGALALAGKTYTQAVKVDIIFIQYGVMAVALTVMAWCACRWIKANMKLENRARCQVIKHLESYGITREVLPDPEDAVKFGYSWHGFVINHVF